MPTVQCHKTFSFHLAPLAKLSPTLNVFFHTHTLLDQFFFLNILSTFLIFTRFFFYRKNPFLILSYLLLYNCSFFLSLSLFKKKKNPLVHIHFYFISPTKTDQFSPAVIIVFLEKKRIALSSVGTRINYLIPKNEYSIAS